MNASNMLFGRRSSVTGRNGLCSKTMPMGCNRSPRSAKSNDRVSLIICHCTSILALLSRTVIHGKGTMASRTLSLLGRIHMHTGLGPCAVNSMGKMSSFLRGMLSREKRRL